MHATSTLTALALVVWTVGCSVRMGGQEIRWRRSGDTAEVLILYERVTATPESEIFRARGRPKNLEDAARWGERFLAGGRVALLGSWPLAFDLDDPEAMAETPDALREVLAGIALDGHGAGVDADGRLCAWQRWTIPDLGALVTAADRAYRDHLSTLAAGDDFARAMGIDDAATLALFRRRLADDEPFVRWVDGSLVFDVPLGPELRRRLLAEGVTALASGAADAALAEEREKNPRQHAELCRILASALDHVRRLEIEDDRVRLTVAVPGGAPVVLLDLERDDEPYDDALLDALRQRGHAIDDEIDRAALLAPWER